MTGAIIKVFCLRTKFWEPHPPKIRDYQRCSLSPLFFSIAVKVLVNTVRQKK